jgi:hypothetical protein
MGDPDRMRDVWPVLHLDGNGPATPRRGRVREVGTQLQKVKTRQAWLGPPVGDLGKAAHFLEQLHYFNFGSHSRS